MQLTKPKEQQNCDIMWGERLKEPDGRSVPQLLPEIFEHPIKEIEVIHADSGDQNDFADPNSQPILQDSLDLHGEHRWAVITLQPELPSTSQEQLAAEVKDIYAGLIMVEAKCINIDAQKASHPHEELSTEQWQALVALHRWQHNTLLLILR
jgi:hypothetical protein